VTEPLGYPGPGPPLNMTKTDRRPSRTLRLAIATLLVVPAVAASVSPSLAAPSQADVQAAKAELTQLQENFAAVNENYNQALYELQQAKDHLAEAKAMRDAAQQQADAARSALQARAVQAYTNMGSQYEALLSADSLTEFSDRLEFLGAITQTDSDLATEADSTSQRAAWAAQEYDQAVTDAQAKADAAAEQRRQAEADLQRMQQLASNLEQQYQDAVAAQQAAMAAAAQDTAPAQPTSSDSGGDGGTGFVPPPNASAAAIAVAAARSVLGAPYVFGAAGPSSFDCSGLTSWAWAQAGVSIVHSASGQYASLPRVPLTAVVPGDIIYYGNFGPHVGIYIGGGQIIHARHPGPGGEVQVSSMYGYDTPYGAVRPG
jgi:cell wall-associated NlpC family hydrolase